MHCARGKQAGTRLGSVRRQQAWPPACGAAEGRKQPRRWRPQALGGDGRIARIAGQYTGIFGWSLKQAAGRARAWQVALRPSTPAAGDQNEE